MIGLYLCNVKDNVKLTDEEIENLFKKMQIASDDEKKKARECLITSHIDLVKKVIYKIFYKNNFEDLVSFGYLGLIKAVDTFDIQRKVKFTTYAFKCIYNEIVTYLRKQKKNISSISLDFIIFDKDLGYITRKEKLLSDFDTVENYLKREQIATLKKFIEMLPYDEYNLISLYYYKELSQREIASEIDGTQLYVSRQIKKILKKFYSQFEAMDNGEDIILSMQINKNNIRDYSSIYDFYQDYTKKQIDYILSLLTPKDRLIIDLVFKKKLPYEDENVIYFYKIIVPKIENLLMIISNSTTKEKQKVKK